MRDYHWNPQKRRYEDRRGREITPVKLRQYVQEYIEAEQSEIDTEHGHLIEGLASVALLTKFFKFMEDKIRDTHGAAGVIAYGGESEMNPERWARIGEKIASEYTYLDGFEVALKQSRQATDGIVSLVPAARMSAVEEAILTVPKAELRSALSTIVGELIVIDAPVWDVLIWGESGSRARMYADSVYSTYENSVKAREGDAGVLSARRVSVDDDASCPDCPVLATDDYLPLDEVADIGDSQCESRCRCWLEFNYAGVEPIEIDREVYV